MTSFLFCFCLLFDLLRCHKAPLLPLFAQGLFGGRIFFGSACQLQDTANKEYGRRYSPTNLCEINKRGGYIMKDLIMDNRVREDITYCDLVEELVEGVPYEQTDTWHYRAPDKKFP